MSADAVEDAALRLQLFRHVCSSPDMSEAMSADSLHVLLLWLFIRDYR